VRVGSFLEDTFVSSTFCIRTTWIVSHVEYYSVAFLNSLVLLCFVIFFCLAGGGVVGEWRGGGWGGRGGALGVGCGGVAKA